MTARGDSLHLCFFRDSPLVLEFTTIIVDRSFCRDKGTRKGDFHVDVSHYHVFAA